MLISVVNRSTALSDAEVQRTVRAINRQFSEDFEPHWQFGARLRLDGAGRAAHTPAGRVSLPHLPGRRGDAVIYLQDKATVDDAEGYHDLNNSDVPFGFVFLDVCKAAGDEWTVALSHEAIELVGDPLNNLLVQGPHPHDHRHLVFHLFELCDAVQGETYELDGVKLSNFLLPGWFARTRVAGARNDFLGRPDAGSTLEPFTIAPGGYLSFYDSDLPEGRKWASWTPPGDADSERRMAAKSASRQARIARRSHPGG